MSRIGATQTARMLGGPWLGAILIPRIRTVAVDLDNTLYQGVLGEDGADGVELTQSHAALQRQLLGLRERGVFLALVSRNHPEDVRELFQMRDDFPLGWEDFSARSVRWHPKSAGIAEVAGELRIGPDSILFVDDNAGELLETAQHVPGLRGVHAASADQTTRALRYFPGLWAFAGSAEDELRVADLGANAEREDALAKVGDDLASYYRELGVRLTIRHGDQVPLQRMAELSGKTNQFNLAPQRYDESELRERLSEGSWQISSAALEDRLTDSGVIAIAVSQRQGARLIVREVCVSCRALGRQLEDVIVAHMLVSGPLFDGVAKVTFPFIDAPRNQPARAWLSEFAGVEVPTAPEQIAVSISADRLREASVNPDVEIEVLR